MCDVFYLLLRQYSSLLDLYGKGMSPRIICIQL